MLDTAKQCDPMNQSPPKTQHIHHTQSKDLQSWGEKKAQRKDGSVRQIGLYTGNRNDSLSHRLRTSHLKNPEEKAATYRGCDLASHNTHNEHIDRQNGHKGEASWDSSIDEEERERELRGDGDERNSECTEEGDWRTCTHVWNDLVGNS